MLKPKSRWVLKEIDETVVKHFTHSMKIPEIVARLLVTRGIRTVEEAEYFLEIDRQAFFNPFLLDEMDKVVARIETAIENGENILVFGDYDADGVTSTTVMVRALRKKGAKVDYYIPNRFTEGYGPNETAFKWAKEANFSLIITVDTGISAVHEADVAKQLGMDLIITDHHEIPEVIPDAFAIIHPRKHGSSYPFGELAGVGVAFKVAHALLGDVPKELLQFAVIGTIADLVPLHSENRLIASLGLRKLNTTTNPGLIKLLDICGMETGEITEETIGFVIGPRLNAAGRLGSAAPAVKLLMEDDPLEAEKLANEIDQLNQERQALVSNLTKEVIEEVEANYPLDENRVLVIAKEGWNPGVVGIVASRLVEKYYRPTIILSIDPEVGTAKGSARSIVDFDLYENLSSCRDILPHFGGHKMAAGMTLRVEHVNELRERLNKVAFKHLTEDQLTPITEIDVACKVEEITMDIIEEIQMLAPFGMGNPKPLALIEDAPFSQMKRIGSDGSHLKVIIGEKDQALDCIGFGCGDLVEEISALSTISTIGELSINEWNGFRKPQLMIKDVAVQDWQLFDFRGYQQTQKLLERIPSEGRVTIAFHKSTIQHLNLHTDDIQVIEDQPYRNVNQAETIILLDLPNSKKELAEILQSNFPSRIYAIFYHKEEHFFSMLPTREHFKWFYGFLLKQKSFDIKKHAEAIAKKKGWTANTIEFMTKVFFDLQFVKIENGLVTLVEKPIKKDISESSTYVKKKEQMEIEQELLYSSHMSLRQWLNELKNGSLKLEEEIVK